MDYENEQAFLSVKLYHYLSDVVVGSEKVVKYRRYVYKCFDDTLSEGNLRRISSGSKAEGLDLPGSDLDIMLVCYAQMVDERQGSTNNEHLILDTDNASPGFSIIKVSDDSDFKNKIYALLTEDGLVLKNDFYKQMCFQAVIEKLSSTCFTKIPDMNVQTLFKLQGPAMSTALKGIVDIDYVFCFPCRKWPSIAKRWLSRNRCGRWPPSDVITEAIHEGVLLVPVGSKSTCSEENNSEWRFSFSLTEKLLVHSFNHSQLLCYALLKIFLKDILDKVNIFNKLLCSYYMKTVLFWILEEVDHKYWVPKNLFGCFLLCLQRLHYFILCNYFPNYFIPEHNMIEGRLTEEVRKQLDSFFKNFLRGNMWKYLLSSDLLFDLRHIECYISRPLHVISEFDKTMINMKIPDWVQFVIDKSFRSLRFFAYKIQNEYCPTFFKNIYAIAFLDFCKCKATLVKMRSVDFQNSSNKHYYSQYKQCLCHLLLNLNSDAVSGWLLLAALFYSCQEYSKMNVTLQLSEEILSRDLYAVSHFADLSASKQITFEKNLVPSRQFLKRLRHSLIRFFIVQKNKENNDSFIFHEDLCLNDVFFSIGTPIVFIRYLTFLYFHKKNNTEGLNHALLLLQDAVEKSPRLNGLSIFINFDFLLRAQSLIGDYEIETIKRMFSFLKDFDVTGLLSGLQSALEEYKLDFNE